MKFKLDENLPLELVDDLRLLGYDVDTVTEEGVRGAEDPVVIRAALSADRILMTLDKGIRRCYKSGYAKRGTRVVSTGCIRSCGSGFICSISPRISSKL